MGVRKAMILGLKILHLCAIIILGIHLRNLQ